MGRGKQDFAIRCRRAATRIRVAKANKRNIYRRIDDELAEEVETLLEEAAMRADDTVAIPRLKL